MVDQVRIFPDFAVACGEEASDPLVLHAGSVVRVDEMAASGHLDRQDTDLAAVAGLGVKLWRYGMPWRLAEPRPGEYDWTLWDRALEACKRHRLEPVVDLCHFGLPNHYSGFCEPSWVSGFVSYVTAFLARYPEPMLFTPVNEPMITAMCSGHLGIWNDRRSTRADYMTALAHVTLANLEALALIDADRAGWWIGAEGFGCHVAATPADEAAAAEARALEQLVWDLHFGVAPRAEVADVADLVDEVVMSRINSLAGKHERVIAGHDFYPVSVTLHGQRAEPLTIDERIAAYEHEARNWYARYRRPFWVAETSNLGLPVADGVTWLERLTASIDRLRSDGLPVHGLCWYSRGDQVDWHTMLTVPVGEVTEVGLFDAERSPRPVAAAYARLATERSDHNHPRFHLRPPTGWVNDPNGVVHHEGRTHVFFQYSRDPDWLIREWGHAVTSDLVHWEQLPVALSPTSGTPDEWGVWSGSIVIDDAGTAHAFYSGLSTAPGPQCPMHAVSTSPDQATWHKDTGGKPVVAGFPEGVGVHTMRDPSVRRTPLGWEMLVGAGLDGGVPAVLRYLSDDLSSWRFDGLFASGDRGVLAGMWTGSVWECPQAIAIGETTLLTVSVFDPVAHHDTAYMGVIHYALWATGGEGQAGFEPREFGVLDRGYFHAPHSLVLDGRVIMFGWIWEGRDDALQRQAGWSGMISLPREVTIDDHGRVRLAPVPELKSLRGANERVGPVHVAADTLITDITPPGDCLEIIAEFDSFAGCDEFGLIVFAGADGDEHTRVGYSAATDSIVIERGTRQRAQGDVRPARLESDPVGATDRVTLHVFLDRSVIEVFANGQALTGRAYRSGPDSCAIGVYSRGGAATLRTLELWHVSDARPSG
jgi:beta-fructofuranosidase